MKGLPFGEYLAVLLVIILQCVALNSLNSSGFALWCISQHGEYFPHPEDCTKFLKCSHDRALVFQCPANLQWNQDLKTCDYPQITGQCGTGRKIIIKEKAVKRNNNQENLLESNEKIFIQNNVGNSESLKVRIKRNCAQDAKLMTSKDNLKELNVDKPIFEATMNKLDLSEAKKDIQHNVDNETLRETGETTSKLAEPFSDSEEMSLKIENIADKTQMSLTKEITKIETTKENHLDSKDNVIKTNQQTTVTNSNNVNKPKPQTTKSIITIKRNESTTTDQLKEFLKTKINPSDFEKISEGNLALESLLKLIENEYYDDNITNEVDLTIEDYNELPISDQNILLTEKTEVLPIPEQNILLTEKNEELASNFAVLNGLNILENNESKNLTTHQNDLFKSTTNFNSDDSDKFVNDESKELPITTNKPKINYNPDDSVKLLIEDPKELPITTKSLLNNNADEREEDIYESVAETIAIVDKLAVANFPVHSDGLTIDLFTEHKDHSTKKTDVYETTTDYSSDKTTNYDHVIREDLAELPIIKTDNIILNKKDCAAHNAAVHDSTAYNTKETTNSVILSISNKYNYITTDSTTNEEEEIVSELPTSTAVSTDLDVVTERISMTNETEEDNSSELPTFTDKSPALIANTEIDNTVKQILGIYNKYNDITTDTTTNGEEGIFSELPTSTMATTDLDVFSENISMTTEADVEEKATNSPIFLEDNSSELLTSTEVAEIANTVTQIVGISDKNNEITADTITNEEDGIVSELPTSTIVPTDLDVILEWISLTTEADVEEKATNSATLQEDSSSKLPTSTEIANTVTQILGISINVNDITTDTTTNEEEGIVSELPTSTMASKDLDVVSERISMTNVADVEEKATNSPTLAEDSSSELPNPTDASTEQITNAEIANTVTQILGISEKYGHFTADTTIKEIDGIFSELPTSTMASNDLDEISEKISMTNEANIEEKATNYPIFLEDNNSELPTSTDASTELITNAEIGNTVNQILGISNKYGHTTADATTQEVDGIFSELPTSTVISTDLDVVSERITMINVADVEEKATNSPMLLDDNNSELPTFTDASPELIANTEIGNTVTQIPGISSKYDITTDTTTNGEEEIISELPTSTIISTDFDVVSERISMINVADVEEMKTNSPTLLEDNNSELPTYTDASVEQTINAEIGTTIIQVLGIFKNVNDITTDTTTNGEEGIVSELPTSTVTSTDIDVISEKIQITNEANVEGKPTNSPTLAEDSSSELPTSTDASIEQTTNAEIPNTVKQLLGISEKYGHITADTTIKEVDGIFSELPTSTMASTDLDVVSERISMTNGADVEEKATNSPTLLEDNSSELPTSTDASTEQITNAEIANTVTQILGISKNVNDISTDTTTNEEEGIVSELPTSTVTSTDIDVISEKISITNEASVEEKPTNSPTLLEDNNSDLPTFTDASPELLANTEIGNTVTQIHAIYKKYGHITADTTTNEEDEIVSELPTSTMASKDIDVFSEKISMTNVADVEEKATNSATLLDDSSSDLPTTTYASTELTTNAEIGNTETQILGISNKYKAITINKEEDIVSELPTSTDFDEISEKISLTAEADVKENSSELPLELITNAAILAKEIATELPTIAVSALDKIIKISTNHPSVSRDNSLKRPSLNQTEVVIEIIKNTTEKFPIETTESTIHDSLNSKSYSKPPPNVLEPNSSKNSISGTIEPIGTSPQTSNIAATTTPFAWSNIFPDPEATPDPRLPFISPLCQGENNHRQFQALKCSQYYQCFAGWAFLLNCRDGNVFSAIQGNCIVDSKMECKE